ncbi:hypothetical protein ACXWTF_12620 [Thiomicrolovo sp. ZZH C-3]
MRQELLSTRKLLNVLRNRKYTLRFSDTDIANVSNVSPKIIKKTLSGNHPDQDTIERIAALLGVMIEYQKQQVTVRSTKPVYDTRVDILAKSVVSRVMRSSALELQAPDYDAAKKIFDDTVKRIKGMPKEKVWRMKT